MISRTLSILLLSSVLCHSKALCAPPVLGSLEFSAGVAGRAAGQYPEAAPPLKNRRALTAYFIDVGQGDAEYIELPNGENVLIDGGPSDPSGSPRPPVADFLARHGVTRISHMVLTHPHADHYTGLRYVADRMKVDNFYDTRIDNAETYADDALRETLRRAGTRVFYPDAGDVLDWAPGEVDVDVLHGCTAPSSASSGQALNDCSIVLKVTYQDTSILYTGDIQSDVEADLVSKFGRGLRSDVLKVPHHGSSSSSSAAFLDMVRPGYAYIEVGENDYGHPTRAALHRLLDAGAEVYRTDLDGTMRYTITDARETAENAAAVR